MGLVPLYKEKETWDSLHVCTHQERSHEDITRKKARTMNSAMLAPFSHTSSLWNCEK